MPPNEAFERPIFQPIYLNSFGIAPMIGRFISGRWKAAEGFARAEGSAKALGILQIRETKPQEAEKELRKANGMAPNITSHVFQFCSGSWQSTSPVSERPFSVLPQLSCQPLLSDTSCLLVCRAAMELAALLAWGFLTWCSCFSNLLIIVILFLLAELRHVFYKMQNQSILLLFNS